MTSIIYYDKDICVCRKPRGVLSEGEGQRALPLLLREELLRRGLRTEVFPIHRLDKDTEGLMVYALTQRAAAELSRQLRDGELTKEYIAELCGRPEKDADELCDLLFYDRKRGKSFVVGRERKGGKEARLSYSLISYDGKYSKVRVRLHTGRTHQIRVQFASHGLPLRGDRRYGAPADSGEFSLLSCCLAFTHPTSGEKMEYRLED